jgi:hypothetical protein
MCDLNSLKESVKEHSEEIIIIKEDYTRMKTHLNVSAKLELQVKKSTPPSFFEILKVVYSQNIYLLFFNPQKMYEINILYFFTFG